MLPHRHTSSIMCMSSVSVVPIWGLRSRGHERRDRPKRSRLLSIGRTPGGETGLSARSSSRR